MTRFLITLIALFLLSCSDRAGSTSEVDIEIALSGTVTDTAMQGVSDVQLYLYSSGTGSLTDTDTTLIDSTMSDKEGQYQFDSLPGGIYHIHANYADSLFASKRNIIYTEQSLAIDTLELTGPGTIVGSVTFDAINKRGVLIYIPGTSYSAYTDSTGAFTIEKVPADSGYSIVASLYGYSTVEVKNISLKSLETKRIQPVYLTANLYPSGLTVHFDSLSRSVSLQWNRLDRDDITGYLVFRKDSLLTALYPEQLNTQLIADTLFTDYLPETLFNQIDTITFEYRIKAQTLNDYTSFSTPAYAQTFIIRNPDDEKTLALKPLSQSTFQGHDEYRLNWNYTGLIDSVKVELTVNNGASWSEITPPIKNRGHHVVKLPNTSAQGLCRFRITALHTPSLYDMSEYFSIEEIERILIKNGDFSAGLQHWTDVQFADNPAEYTITHEDGKVRFDIEKAGDYKYQIRFTQINIPLMEGKKYRLSLDAHASQEFRLWVGLQQTQTPWKQYEIFYFDLDTTESSETVYFNVSITDPESAITLDFGGGTGTVWIDNVSLELVERE